jgi:predicted permease
MDVIQTILPILLLIGLGFFSRKIEILKSDDERVLSAYVYHFALPSLFLVNMAKTEFNVEIIKFMFVGIIPIFVAISIIFLSHLILKFSKNHYYLLILSTIFGSLSFFGIPFIMFAFPAQGEQLATLSSASISPVSVTLSITVLELYKLEKSSITEGLKTVMKKLSKNPLIISILSGISLSLIGVEIPAPISSFLHMLGGTTSTVAIFMLGVFLYGKRYTNKIKALKLGLLRIVFLPFIALLTTMLFHVSDIERSILVLMHSMPVAISMIILSERYDFYKETIASLILVSSLGAGVYLNLWLYLLKGLPLV